MSGFPPATRSTSDYTTGRVHAAEDSLSAIAPEKPMWVSCPRSGSQSRPSQTTIHLLPYCGTRSWPMQTLELLAGHDLAECVSGVPEQDLTEFPIAITRTDSLSGDSSSMLSY